MVIILCLIEHVIRSSMNIVRKNRCTKNWWVKIIQVIIDGNKKRLPHSSFMRRNTWDSEQTLNPGQESGKIFGANWTHCSAKLCSFFLLLRATTYSNIPYRWLYYWNVTDSRTVEIISNAASGKAQDARVWINEACYSPENL